MISYLVQEAIGGIMKLEKAFDDYPSALRFFDALSRGTGSETKDVWVVAYDDETQEELELAHKEVKPI